MQLSVQMEKPSSITRKLTIRVPAETVTKRLEKGLYDVQRTAKLKGFRPGQVPLSIVKQYYGEDVNQRVFHDLIEESFHEAAREQQIKAVGAPKIEEAPGSALKEGQDLTFIATVEVIPEIEAKGYTGISLNKGNTAVGENDVELVIKNLADSHAELNPVSARSVQKNDYVDMTFDGGIVQEDGSIKAMEGMKGTRMLEVGSDSLIPGFEDNLIGMNKGETKKFRVKFPDTYHAAELAGEDSEFTVTINEVKEKKLPELTDEFAKTVGYENLADMTSKAKEHLIRERNDEVERKLRSDLLQELINKNSFEVPAALIQAQTRALAQDVAQNLKQQGFNDDMIKGAVAQELERLKQRAENQVRASLILEAIAKKEKIEVSAEEIDTEIKSMAASMKIEEPKIREFYEKNADRREDLIFRMREDRTVKFLLEKSKIKQEK
jgi:trigger factor